MRGRPPVMTGFGRSTTVMPGPVAGLLERIPMLCIFPLVVSRMPPLACSKRAVLTAFFRGRAASAVRPSLSKRIA